MFGHTLFIIFCIIFMDIYLLWDWQIFLFWEYFRFFGNFFLVLFLLDLFIVCWKVVFFFFSFKILSYPPPPHLLNLLPPPVYQIFSFSRTHPYFYFCFFFFKFPKFVYKLHPFLFITRVYWHINEAPKWILATA